MGLSSTDWTALGSIFTAVAAFVALGVGIVPYRQQNHLARATTLRGLVRAVLHDSQEISDLTAYASSVLPDAQVRAFRRQLGETATVNDFLDYFFADDISPISSPFIKACLDSPAYSRLSALWDDIDRTSAELRGSLRTLNDAAELIIRDSQTICFPRTSINIARDMASDDKLAAECKGIDNIDKLVIALSRELSKRLHAKPYNRKMDRLKRGRLFIESLASAIRDVTDRSLRSLSEGISDWSELLTPELLSYEERLAIDLAREQASADDSEMRKLDNIEQLMRQVMLNIPAKDARDLERRFVTWREAYFNGS